MTKDTYIRFRLTEDEKELIKLAAERLNMSMYDYVRSYPVLISRNFDDISTGTISTEIAQEVLRYTTNNILRTSLPLESGYS